MAILMRAVRRFVFRIESKVMPNSDAKPGAFSRGPSLRKRLTLWAAGIALIVQVVVGMIVKRMRGA